MKTLQQLFPPETLGWFIICLAICLTYAVPQIFTTLMKLIAVWKRGYPPAHCDALGDAFYEQPRREEAKVIKVNSKSS